MDGNRGPRTTHERDVTRRTLLGYGALTLLGGVAAACGVGGAPASPPAASSSAGSSSAKRAEQLSTAGAAPATINPLSTLINGTSLAIWDPLLWLDPARPDQPVPMLATSWKRLDDSTLEFTLRQNVKFSDGSAFTSEDVKFTIETVMGEKLSAFSLIPTVAQVTTPDPFTVRVSTNGPDPILEKRIATIPIVPKAVYSKTGTSKFSQQPVGTGRYKVSKWDPADGLYLEASPAAWAGAPQTPKWVVRYMPNVQAQVNALEAGEIDLLGLGSGADYLTQLGDRFNIRSVPAGSFRTLRLDTTKGPFKDVRVRRALQAAVDVPALLTSVDKGFAVEGSGQPFLQNCFGFDPNLKAVPFDLAKAKSLLADAGYASGFQTGISSVGFFHPLLAALSGMFAKIGVTATVVDLDGPAFVKETYGLSTEGMFMSPWSYQPLYDAEQVYRFATVTPKNWDDPKWDAMLAQERTTMDPAKRLGILQGMAAYMQDQAPWILIDGGAFAWVWSKKVTLDPYTGQWFLYHTPYKTL